MSSALLSRPMSSTACGVGFMPDEVRTKSGSWKCFRSFAKLMLIADWLKSRFSAVCDTLRVLFSSVTTASSFKSMLVTSETRPTLGCPHNAELAYHRNACNSRQPAPGRLLQGGIDAKTSLPQSDMLHAFRARAISVFDRTHQPQC